MPLPCKKPKYAYKNNVRLTFCGNKVVEAKKKSIIKLENKVDRKIRKSPKGKYYYIKNKKKNYVKV